MQRVLVGSQSPVLTTFYDGSWPSVDPGLVDVTVYRDDGTQASSGSAAVDEGEAIYYLPAEAASSLDRLRVVFASANNGSRTEYIEVVGGFLCELADIRTHPDIVKQQGLSPTDDELAAARNRAEDRFEEVCGYAFVPRYGRRSWRIAAPVRLAPYLRAVRSLTVNGTDIPAPYDFTAESGFLRLNPHRHPGFWDGGFADRYGSATATFEHGLDAPPEPVRWAVLTLAKEYLTHGPVTERATQIGTELGAAVNLSTPGFNGAHFGIPEVDAIADRNRLVVMA